VRSSSCLYARVLATSRWCMVNREEACRSSWRLFQRIMMISHTGAVGCGPRPIQTCSSVDVTFQNPQILGEVGKLENNRPQLTQACTARARTHTVLMNHPSRFAIPLEPQFSWIKEKPERDAEARSTQNHYGNRQKAEDSTLDCVAL